MTVEFDGESATLPSHVRRGFSSRVRILFPRGNARTWLGRYFSPCAEIRSLARSRDFPVSRATPMMREFAARLIAFDTKGNKSLGAKIPAGFVACEKLRPQLVMLMGSAGYHAVLARALALASAEVPRLSAVRVQADGSVAGLDEIEAPAEREKLLEGSVVVLAQLLGLLEAFVGENLMLRLLYDVWPKLTLSGLFFDYQD